MRDNYIFSKFFLLNALAIKSVTGCIVIQATKPDSLVFINKLPAAGYVACRGLQNWLPAA